MSLYIDIDEVTFANNKEDGDGYQTVKRIEEGDLRFLKIQKEKESDYPLILESHEEIDVFCDMLHTMLGQNKTKEKTKKK